jgi:hypothetical protein
LEIYAPALEAWIFLDIAVRQIVALELRGQVRAEPQRRSSLHCLPNAVSRGSGGQDRRLPMHPRPQGEPSHNGNQHGASSDSSDAKIE